MYRIDRPLEPAGQHVLKDLVTDGSFLGAGPDDGEGGDRGRVVVGGPGDQAGAERLERRQGAATEEGERGPPDRGRRPGAAGVLVHAPPRVRGRRRYRPRGTGRPRTQEPYHPPPPEVPHASAVNT